MEIELHGHASVSADIRTVHDLIKFAHLLEIKQVDQESEVDFGSPRLHVDLRVHEMDWIECGDHRPIMRPDGEWTSWSDVILITHGHDSEIPGQMTTDEIIEPQHMHESTDYDWGVEYGKTNHIVCDECGISSKDENFGIWLTRIQRKTGDYGYLCEPCAEEEPPKYDWPLKDRLKRFQELLGEYL